MKLFSVWVLLCVSLSSAAQPILNPEEWVNPLMGTDSKYNLSNGNTYPAISLPWGMNSWTPQTNKNGDGWQYQYSADKIVGFKQTHQPSPWINDYGCFSIMPVTKKLVWKEKDRASWFSHKAETATPYYYKVYLADADVTAEITPTDRCAVMKFSFPDTDSAFIIIDAFDKRSAVEIDAKNKTIRGFTTSNNGGVSGNFKNYFVITCNKPFSYSAVADENNVWIEKNNLSANHSYAIIGFSTKKGEEVILNAASSFIDPNQANINLQREIGNNSFNQIYQTAKLKWHEELSKIKVEGGTEEQFKTFYSCLYRVLLFPRKFYEIDHKGNIIHYSPYNGKVEKGYLFTDNGFWDTFRAVFPLFTLVYPELNQQIMQGLVNTYKESGWLPEWASPGHRDCMIGSNSASIVADSYIKGIRGYDINTLYEAIIKNSNNEGPLSSVGRKGVALYNELGYVPYDAGINESAARTLEYAYADFCIAQLAKKLNKSPNEIQLYEKRALNYRNLFDTAHLLMRGKNKNGQFQYPFNPFKWGDAFTEGNSWHYTWSVFQDVNGLKQLMGGSKMMEKMLDSVFALPPVYDESYYGQVIHEIKEMQIANMGQYAHGNQPIQHMIYLYNYCGASYKAQMHVRNVMEKLYKPLPDGYCGDEDNGQTSAWYIFSALGFYPVCPGTDEYVFGAPLFKKATLHLANGKKFYIEAKNNNKQRKYVQYTMLNQQLYQNCYIKHDTMLKGGKLVFSMSENPSIKSSNSHQTLPFSLTK